MHAKTVALAALAAVLVACSPSKQADVKAPDAIDRMGKAEVEAIVKEYLLREPEVLVSAFEELDKRHNANNFALLTAHQNDPWIGPKDAPITIVEFFDYNCGYCKAANDWVFKQVDDKAGKVRIVFKEFPILRDSSHMASLAALAANRQGKYREMHLALMHSKALAPMQPGGGEDLEKTQAEIDRIAKSIGLDIPRMKKDMESKELSDHIERVHREAAQTGVESTPGFYINGQTLQGWNEQQLNGFMKTARDELKT